MSTTGVVLPPSSYRQPDRDSDAFEAFVERLGIWLESKGAEAQGGFAELAEYEIETNFAQSATALTVAPQTTNLFLVQAIIAVIPAGATGTLTLGPIIIPITGSFPPVLAPVKFLLAQPDQRTLTSSAAGQLSLTLMGVQRSPRSLLR